MSGFEDVALQIVNVPVVHGRMMEEIDRTYYGPELRYSSDTFQRIMSNESFVGVIVYSRGNPLAYIIGAKDLEDIPPPLQGDAFYVTSQAHNKE